MQITEQLIERIARRVFNSMFAPALRQSNVQGGGTPSSVRYAEEAGHAASADSADAVPWTGVSGKPTTATRWPTWDEVTDKPSFAAVATSGSYNDLSNKPSIPSVSGNVSGSTMTITINGTAYSLTDTNTWRPLGTGASDAAAGNHLHDGRYLKLTGGTITGDLTVNQTFTCQSVEIGHTNEINATGSSNLYLQYRNSGHLVLCHNGQNVGIGTDSPSYKLHVAGTIYATGSITERSDIRCKDVETYQWSPTLDMIADAPIIRYTMKDDKMHRMRVGSVAQYWEKMIPETVSKDNEGILSIAQGDICMVSVIAMAREVRKLREEVKQLKNGRS